MLLGEYNHTIDEKSRVIVPSKFRDDLGSTFVVTKGFDKCLFAFSISEWQNFESQLKALPLSNENARKYVRYFMAGATECQVDKQGRVLIPANLKEHAGLKKECDDLAAKSEELLLKEWRSQGHVHENYNAYDGMGCNLKRSDKFYHWGGLLAYIALDNEENK